MSGSESGSDRNVVLILVAVVVGGVVLLALAVIVAAVVGSFVLGVGDASSETTPRVQFEVTTGEGTVTITHAGGDSVDADRLVLSVNEERRGTWGELSDGGAGVEVGDSVELDGVAAGDTVRVRWIGDASEAVLFRTTV
ncbi:type IV pilin [Haloarcula litorea]|uniref:type IV pilin n=1 Tax=Haloarcula litorea TaxID=3032579 RepID=UPI0023E8B342|nr:type IV pilin [Halomicroarcula sp. GDY20]